MKISLSMFAPFRRAAFVEPHGFTAVAPMKASAEPAEAARLRQGFGGHPSRIPPQLDSRGFLRRRVKVRRRRGPRRRSRGFTMVEVMFVLAIIATLFGLVFPLYVSYLEKARVARAIVEIRGIEKVIDLYDFTKGAPPDSLAEAGIGITPDPWGSPYEYLKINCVESGGGKKCKAPKGARKDKFLKPINSDYDLYSMGKNRESKTPLQSSKSRDDVVRANDGTFIGLATDF